MERLIKFPTEEEINKLFEERKRLHFAIYCRFTCPETSEELELSNKMYKCFMALGGFDVNTSNRVGWDPIKANFFLSRS